VWGDYKWDNIKEYLTAGKLPDFSKDVNEDVLISQFLANRLKLKVGDLFRVNYLISGGLKSLGFLILDFKN
jgi:lipoprotein-releasing system permease protein